MAVIRRRGVSDKVGRLVRVASGAQLHIETPVQQQIGFSNDDGAACCALLIRRLFLVVQIIHHFRNLVLDDLVETFFRDHLLHLLLHLLDFLLHLLDALFVLGLDFVEALNRLGLQNVIVQINRFHRIGDRRFGGIVQLRRIHLFGQVADFDFGRRAIFADQVVVDVLVARRNHFGLGVLVAFLTFPASLVEFGQTRNNVLFGHLLNLVHSPLVFAEVDHVFLAPKIEEGNLKGRRRLAVLVDVGLDNFILDVNIALLNGGTAQIFHLAERITFIEHVIFHLYVVSIFLRNIREEGQRKLLDLFFVIIDERLQIHGGHLDVCDSGKVNNEPLR